MKKIVYAGLIGVLGLAGISAPAMAATGSEQGQVPYCSSTTAHFQLSNGDYQSELARQGETVNSIEIWNGCVKAVYTDASGHSSTAIYDPDTLQLLTTLSTDNPQG